LKICTGVLKNTKMKITIKKLEIFFLIVYFVIAVFCYFFFGVKCLLGSFFGALISILDWFLIKFMSVRWIKHRKYSFVQNSLRYVVVGFSIWALFKMHLNVLGIVAGLSVVPITVMAVSIITYFKKDVNVE